MWQWVVGVVVAVELFGRLFALLFKVEFVVLFVDVADTTNTFFFFFREFFLTTGHFDIECQVTFQRPPAVHGD